MSTTKFVVMSLATFGVYNVYWMYQQWVFVRARTNEDLSPFWRTFFGPIYTFSLFRRISRAAEETGSGGLAHQLYALAYIISLFTVRLPPPYWMISMFAFVPLIPVQSAATRVNGVIAPGSPPNDRYTLPNVAMIAIGGLMLLILVAALFIPVEPMDTGAVNVSV
ncbi:MAG: hypothetical protein EXR93_07235 [Gemmatimonadetes bacterium]|nr:hypothetical protein [Gemmatimonadota bacterium]